MKTVIHITESLGGGVLTSIKSLCEVQRNSNFEVIIGYLRRPDTPKRAELELLFPGIKLIEIWNSNAIGLIKMSFFAVHYLKNNNRVHAHSSWAGFLVRGVNVFIRTSFCYYTPHSYAHLRTDISKYKKSLFKFIEIVLNLTSKTSVISCSPTEASIASKLFAHSVAISRNYIKDPKPVFGKMNLSVSKSTDNFKVAVVGRIAHQKNPIRYCKVIQTFDDFVETEWIGSGPLENLLSQNNARVTGWLGPEEVSKKISNLDVLLITSEWEGLSMAGIEALSHGIPIISWAYQGCEDLVIHGFNGFICHNEAEFIQYIRELHFNSELFIMMKINAREYFLKNFDQRILYHVWEKLYEIEPDKM